MRTIERLLQISIAAMAVLGTWMMSLGGQTPMMTELMLVAAICGVVFTDILRWFQLHRLIVNLVAIVAMVLTLSDFLQRDSTGQLLSIAYLLISWEAVMLFQEKTARVYWCIAVLSLLQVVVASVLNVDIQFGALLLVYLTVGFFGMVFFFLARELHRVESRRRTAAASGASVTAMAEDSPKTLVQRLPLRQLMTAAASLGLVSLLFGVVFFYGAPRLRSSNWSQGRLARAQTGFTTQVSLREMGEILQSNQRVMRVSLSKFPSGEDYPVFGEPYFHGAVLTRYRDGLWRGPMEREASSPLPATSAVVAAARGHDLVRMNVTMEQATDATLFSAPPCYRDRMVTSREIQFIDARQQLVRSSIAGSQSRFRYTIVSGGFRNGIQSLIRPHENYAGRGTLAMQLGEEREQCLEIDFARFPGLVDLAEKILTEAPQANVVRKARALEAHLKDTSRYSYTLNFESIARRRNQSLDPIEDFVLNHRAGHCEYFASALVLMLRSQNIPARMAVGFHGGIRNQLTGEIEVRQKHAHAWVEAYLEPHQVPATYLASAERPAGGAWLRLDPTPAGGDGAVQRDSLDRVLDFAQLFWNDYVVEMNPDTQQKTLDRALGDAGPLSLDVGGWFGGLKTAGSRAIAAIRGWIGGQWFSWRAGVVAMALGLAAVSLVRIAAPLLGWLRRRWGQRRSAAKRSAPVEFYVRLERLLAKLRLVRGDRQTQREFAQAAATRLRSIPALAPVSGVPAEVTEAFYLVRFGQAALDNQQSAQIERSLEQLAEAVRNASSTDLSADHTNSTLP